MKKIDQDTRLVVDILLAMRAFDRDLPDATSLLTAGARKTKGLRDAYTFAKSRKALSFKAEGELCGILAEALPSWDAARWISFARNFYELTRGKTPTVKMFDPQSGEVSLEPVAPSGGATA